MVGCGPMTQRLLSSPSCQGSEMSPCWWMQVMRVDRHVLCCPVGHHPLGISPAGARELFPLYRPHRRRSEASGLPLKPSPARSRIAGCCAPGTRPFNASTFCQIRPLQSESSQPQAEVPFSTSPATLHAKLGLGSSWLEPGAEVCSAARRSRLFTTREPAARFLCAVLSGLPFCECSVGISCHSRSHKWLVCSWRAGCDLPPALGHRLSSASCAVSMEPSVSLALSVESFAPQVFSVEKGRFFICFLCGYVFVLV